MDMTLRQMIEQTIGELNQWTTNREETGSFVSLVGGVLTVTPSSAGTMAGEYLCQIGHELVHVTNFDSETGTGSVPAWGRAQQGTSQYTASAGDKVVFDPVWSYWSAGRAIIEGIEGLYPSLFKIGNTTLESEILSERYELPDDFEAVLGIGEVGVGPASQRRPIPRFSVDTSETDGNRYIYFQSRWLSGQDIDITYRAKPVAPVDPSDGSWLFSDSGLPTSAADLPILHAKRMLIMSPEAAKVQNMAAEQSDRNRYVQTGAGSAMSRRFEELYQRRLIEEMRKQLDTHPPLVHKRFN